MPTAPFPAPTARPIRSLALDGWRAVACLLVLFHHTGFWLHWGPVAVWGFTGVHFFFVLSGYLLFRPFGKMMRADEPFGFKRFYLRRFLRIYPAYLLALLAYSAVRFASRLHPPSAHDFLTHLLLAFNSTDPREFFGINVAFWTLAIEAQFYVLLPLLVFVVYRVSGRRTVPAMFAAATLFLCLGLGARAWELLHTTGPSSGGESAIRFHTVFSFLDFFAAGMFVAAFEAASAPAKTLARWPAGTLLAGGTALFLSANRWCSLAGNGDWMLVNDSVFLWAFPPLLCAGLAMILYTVVRSEGFVTAALANPVLVYIGKISYSVYLFHILVQLPIFKLLPLTWVHDYTLRTFCWGLISAVPTLAVATVTFRLVEAPFLRLAGRLRAPALGPVSVASAPLLSVTGSAPTATAPPGS